MIQWRYVNPEQTAVVATFSDGHSESHLVTADVIQAWINSGNTPLPYEPPPVDPKEQAKADLAASDREMARTAEDLISVLIAKGLMAIDDLPKPVIAKLENRAALRKVLQADDD